MPSAMPKPTSHRYPLGQALALLAATWLLAGCGGDPLAKPGIHEVNGRRLFVNSLGMQFVPLPNGDAWISVWETRVADYAAFASATTNGWQAAWFQDTDRHPAVNVSWDNAQAFCAWLSQRERATGLLADHEGYRLPTSSEWTAANNDIREERVSPRPKTGSANFSPKLGSDNFEHTSPIGSFPGNTLGLHDLRGNVWEWCTAWPNEEGIGRILRGGGWRDDNPGLLAPGRKLIVTPKTATEDYGFRCILVLKSPAKLH
ncbi:MAG: SUMF1/EgtB/PvdO family nonheme iron enzyme [Verrucomicrobiota bacterium]|jgi:formylglycine-generating enzyme required for sulfatase activity|nr:SUMF1/EgtB/PvdO family nonheme iron enzyme [Verrucomicrobiota bacterium]MDP7049929.1 SUMF1/EgtB/PvdO family nonheme iron enzyme [Verrucomicrobiota bacterium]